MLSQLHGGTQMFIILFSVPSCILYILRRKKCFKIHDIILISLTNAGK